MNKIAYLISVMALLLASCASEPTTDPNIAACQGWASAVCTAQEKCAPFALSSTWGDASTCEARRSAICLATLRVAGTAANASTVSACASAIKAASCEINSIIETLPACLPVAGSLAAGAACAVDSQCISTYCRITAGVPGTACGTCAARAPEGQLCYADSDCQGDLKCYATQSVKHCMARAQIGEKCDDTHICIAPATCQGTTCAAPAALGAKCDVGTKNCDAGQGAYCHDQKALCTAFKTAKEGAACNLINGEFVKCSYGLTCGDLKDGIGTCKLIPDQGEACSSGDNPPCRAGLICDAGLCGVAKFSSCK